MASRQRHGNLEGGPGRVAPARGRSIATWLFLFAALALFFDGIAGERGWFANRRDSEQLQQAEAALEARRQENAALRDFARRLKGQDPDTIEELARRELGYIRPGETVFIVRDVPHPAKQ